MKPQYCLDIWNFLGHFFRHLFLPPSTETVICPSHNETRGSFATILDGKRSLIDWIAFYLMRRLELESLIGDSGWSTVFCCFLRSLHDC